MKIKYRIVCAVTHVDEPTLDLCIKAIRSQSLPVDDVHIVSGVSPASAAFNQCLDFALERKADILVHLAADCILAHNAFETLVRQMELSTTYAMIGSGFDMINGENAPIGLWALNMRAIGDRYRFRDAFKMDLDFCERIEAGTGMVRAKTKFGLQLGYHHPIWLPEEIYRKFRYNAQKYRGSVIDKYLRFFDRCLAVNPDNSTLQVGLIGLKRGAAESHDLGGPLHGAFDAEWAELKELVHLKDGDFFAFHSDFVALGHTLLNSAQEITPMADDFFSPGTFNPRATRAVDQPISAAPAKPNTSPGLLLLSTGLGVKRGLQVAKSTAKDVLRPYYRLLPPSARAFYRQVTAKGAAPAKGRAKTKPKNLPMLRYGAANTGRADWAERWDNAEKSKRVLLVAPKDFAGSMYKWTEAINRHTDYAARLVAFETHQYDYPVDLIVPACDDERLKLVLQLVDEASVLHLKDEHSWFLGGEKYPNLQLLSAAFFSDDFSSKRKVFTHYGGYARKFRADAKYIDAVGRFDARIAMTPDLNFEWFDGAYIPHTIDVDQHQFTWSDTRVFAHSPSSPEKKATYLFEETVALAPRQYPAAWEGWSYDLIHGVSFEECLRRKGQASLFFDQAGRHRVSDLGIDDIIGWYGNSAIEAMAHGIPTMAHLSEYAFSRSAAAGVDLSDIPVINIARSRQSMMDEFVRFATSAPEERLALARRTRDFTVGFHGYAACAARLQQVYATIAQSAPREQVAVQPLA